MYQPNQRVQFVLPSPDQDRHGHEHPDYDEFVTLIGDVNLDENPALLVQRDDGTTCPVFAEELRVRTPFIVAVHWHVDDDVNNEEFGPFDCRELAEAWLDENEPFFGETGLFHLIGLSKPVNLEATRAETDARVREIRRSLTNLIPQRIEVRDSMTGIVHRVLVTGGDDDGDAARALEHFRIHTDLTIPCDEADVDVALSGEQFN